jgi:hypothetical protein
MGMKFSLFLLKHVSSEKYVYPFQPDTHFHLIHPVQKIVISSSFALFQAISNETVSSGG